MRRIGHAKDVQDRNDHRRQIGPRQRPHTADDHDHKDRPDDTEIHQQISTAFGQLQRAAKPCKRTAQKEDARKQPSLIDAKGTDHLAVLGGGAHQGADAGFRDQVPQGEGDKGRDDDQRDVILRYGFAHDADHPFEPRRARPQQIGRSPDHQRQILYD